MTSTVACPACRDAVALDAVTRSSRRARCGCGARFDLLPPGEDGGPFGLYRGDGQEARLTPPPVDEDIIDLSGRRRTRFVRIHTRHLEGRERILRSLGAGAISGIMLSTLAWAVAHSVGSSASLLVFLSVLAITTSSVALFAMFGDRVVGPREIWIEDGAIHWGRGRSRSLGDIDGVCLDAHDMSHIGTKSHAVTTHHYLAFPLPSGKADRFMRVDQLTDEAREWLAQHLNDGIELAKAARS